MKKLPLLYCVLIGLSFCTQTMKAQFIVSAELRPRFEFRDGYKEQLSEDDKPAFVTSQRSRLNIGFNKEKLEVYLSLQDVRVWGDEIYSKDNGTFGLSQAFAKYSFNDKFNMKLGRQILNYDNGRLLASKNWNNVGASHDAALFSFNNNKFTAHVVGAYNNDKEKNKENNYPTDYYKYLALTWLNFSFTKNTAVSALCIADGYQKTGDKSKIYNRITPGIYFKTADSEKTFGGDGAFYYQNGYNRSGNKINAYYFSASLFYKYQKLMKIQAGLEYFSGTDSDTASKEDNSFDKLYGSGHALNGYMDYYTTFPADTKSGGLLDFYGTINVTVTKKLSIELTPHIFRLTADLTDTVSTPGVTKTMNKKLGSELDLTLNYAINDAVEIKGGYSAYFGTKTTEMIKGGDSDKYQQWAFIMITIKPTLFKYEFKEEEVAPVK